MGDGDKIIVEGKVGRIIYPRSKKDYKGWSCFVFTADKIIEGNIDVRALKGTSISMNGFTPLLDEFTRYKVEAEYKNDPKYGPGYKVNYIGSITNLTTKEGVTDFLRTILPDKTIENLFDFTDNPIELIESGDIKALCCVPGIGSDRAQKIIEKFKDTSDKKELYALFTSIGLTKNLADNLAHQYGSPDLLINDIKTNPYLLIKKCNGIGWSRADDIAKKMGMSETSEDRMAAFVEYFLETTAETEGHTWIVLSTLLSGLMNLSNKITKEQAKLLLRKMVDDGELYYDKELKRIGLQRYRNLEQNICNELVRLRDAEVVQVKYIDETIKDCEKVVGFEYTQEQKDAIYKIFNNNVFLLTANAGCVDKDTEFFNGEKWKKISEYNGRDMVLQYNSDGTATLTKPLMYFKKPCDKLYHFETKYGINQTVCEEHNIIYWNNSETQKNCGIKEIVDKQRSDKSGFSGKFKTNFVYGGNGINLTDDEIRVMCAVICDGSFGNTKSTNKYCRIHIKKDRKKDRLRELLNRANIEFREKDSKSLKAVGYTDFYFKSPMRTKVFDEYWYSCSNHQMQIICDEIMYWDGTISKTKRGVEQRRFSTTIKESADFIQFAFSACGYRATIRTDNRVGGAIHTYGKTYSRKSVCYEVVISTNTLVGLCSDSRLDHKKTKIQEVKSQDGYKYCFMVESTMLVLRRNNCIFITGNCGKTTIMYPVARILRRNNLIFDSCALSGKASLNLSEMINENGSTIHKLLHYDPIRNKFIYDSDNKIPTNVVILDEVSMVGGELFYSLIRALETGTKLIMIGDPGQLESIGLCNLINDIKCSGKIAQSHLTKIFRQAQRSGIISDSLKIYHQEQILSNQNSIGREVHGELKDFEIITKEDVNGCLKATIDKFKELYFEKKIPIGDIIIVDAKRSIGALSSRNLNQVIQDMLEFNNKNTLTYKYSDQIEYTITFHVNDRVLVTKNNYKTESVFGENYPIFNGNIGTVVQVCPNELIVSFDGTQVICKEDVISTLQLGYAITCHKSQGTGFPYVIAVCDPTAFNLLSKEHLYTEITRAKKYCTLIGTPKSISTSIRTTRVVRKQTFLGEMLLET